MPERVGAVLPPPDELSDLEEVMVGVDQPPQEEMEDAEELMDAVGSLGGVDQWTSPEAKRRGKNFVRHTRNFGGQHVTVYDNQGNDYRVLKEDLPALLDREMQRFDGQGAGMAQRFLRCPLCKHLPNRGLHQVAGPNGCPGKPKRMYTYCDVCRANGNTRLIYEDEMPKTQKALAGVDMDDANLMHPAQPSDVTREAALQAKLDDHIRAFHITIARRRGLRRE